MIKVRFHDHYLIKKERSETFQDVLSSACKVNRFRHSYVDAHSARQTPLISIKKNLDMIDALASFTMFPAVKKSHTIINIVKL